MPPANPIPTTTAPNVMPLNIVSYSSHFRLCGIGEREIRRRSKDVMMAYVERRREYFWWDRNEDGDEESSEDFDTLEAILIVPNFLTRVLY